MASNGNSKKTTAAPVVSSIPGVGWSNYQPHPAPLSQQQQTALTPYTATGKLELYSQHRRWIGLQSSGWTRIGEGAANDARHASSSSSSNNNGPVDLVQEAYAIRCLIAQLCETFYRAGWATGTGGGVSIRVGGPAEQRPWRVFVAPSGVQKEDMIGDDVFELDMDRNVVVPPKTPGLKQSACTPLWYVVYKHRPAVKAVIHTHSMHAVTATLLDPTEQSKSITLTHLEMMKGVGYHAYDDVLEIPIIDNRPTEDQLADQLEQALIDYPKSNAVLVRRHGIYVWGDSWEQAKTQAECFDYLLDCAVKLKAIGVDPARIPNVGTYRVDNDNNNNGSRPAKKQKVTDNSSDAAVTGGFHGKAAYANATDLAFNTIPLLPRDASYKVLLLDIEGCTTAISFVKETLFPFARNQLDAYLQKANTTPGTDAYKKLCQSLQDDVKTTLDAMNSDERKQAETQVDKESVESMVAFLMDRDCKTAGLKALQGNMWEAGYKQGELKGHVYADVKPMLEWMKKHNVPVYIYSSGSVHAQKLLFGHSEEGDLLPWLKGHFDIPTAGNKKEATSYTAIAKALQLDVKSIVFCSDAVVELKAAQEAGIGQTIMTIRPGNAPLSAEERNAYPAIHSLLQICGSD